MHEGLNVCWCEGLALGPGEEPGHAGEDVLGEGDGEHDHRGVHLRDALQGLQISDTRSQETVRE